MSRPQGNFALESIFINLYVSFTYQTLTCSAKSLMQLNFA